MPCCEYQIFMTLSSLPPRSCHIVIYPNNAPHFSNMSPLHPDMPCFTSQYAVFRTAKGGISHNLTLVLLEYAL